MRIKLSSVVSDLLGVSARRMLEGIAKGETDAQRLAEMADPNLRAGKEQLCNVLQAVGHLDPRYRRVLKQYLDQLELNERQVQELEVQLARIAATPRGGGRATGGNSGLGGGLGTADHRRDRSRSGEVSVGRGSEFLGGDLPGAGRVGGEIRERGIPQRERVDAQHIGSGGQCGGEGEGHRL
jgi:hypothetical protein